MIERIALFILFLLGFAVIVGHKNVVKKIFGLNIINNAAVILFVLEGAKVGTQAPILTAGAAVAAFSVVDPVPQALMLTAIVIGVCITALALALAFRLYKVTGTFDIDEMYRRIHHEP